MAKSEKGGSVIEGGISDRAFWIGVVGFTTLLFVVAIAIPRPRETSLRREFQESGSGLLFYGTPAHALLTMPEDLQEGSFGLEEIPGSGMLFGRHTGYDPSGQARLELRRWVHEPPKAERWFSMHFLDMTGR